jgi:outer membrane biosynthesis protein TonB
LHPVRDDAFFHELFDERVERLQPGGPKVHRISMPLAPGVWLLQVTITAGLSNVNVTTRLVSEHASGRLVGGAHNGAMNPHFGQATVMAFIGDLAIKAGQKAEFEVSFEATGPNAVALVGQRAVSVLARRHATPAAKPAPAPKPEPAPKQGPVAKASPVKPEAAKPQPPKPAPVKAAVAPKPEAPKPAAKPPAKAVAAPVKAPAPAPAKPVKPAAKTPAPVKAAVPAKPSAKKQTGNKRK